MYLTNAPSYFKKTCVHVLENHTTSRTSETTTCPDGMGRGIIISQATTNTTAIKTYRVTPQIGRVLPNVIEYVIEIQQIDKGLQIVYFLRETRNIL